MHVLFDESNSLSENDVQDEDFELGLSKKDCVSNQEQGVRISKRDQVLDLILTQISRPLIKQGEQQLNPVCSRDQQKIQNQAPDQEQKQAL